MIQIVVYDQDNQNLHLAESADCGSNLVAIGRGKDAVPAVTGDCSAPSFPDVPAPMPTPAMTMAMTMGKMTTSVVKSISASAVPVSKTWIEMWMVG